MKFADFEAQFSPEPQRKGTQFERACKWFLEHDPRYAFSKVWLWNDWPSRWGTDCGIDLIAEDTTGRIWAIQSKAYSPAHSVTKADVDSFLSESNRPEISVRLLIASTNNIGTNAARVMSQQDKPVHQVLRTDLEHSPLDWPDDVETLSSGGRKQAPTPRPHQRKAIQDVVDGFKSNERGQLIMACGTGKTLTALWITEAMHSERTLVLVPSLALLSQTLTEWMTADARGMKFLPVCSDETVRNSDSFTERVNELGYPVTTDSEEIAAFLQCSGPLVVFATYQSSPGVAEAMATNAVPKFDLTIADEAHRCAGRVAGAFATVLDPQAIRSHRRLFMTATPKVYTQRIQKQAELDDVEVASMDDTSSFGSVLHRLSFGDAIRLQLLTDYRVAVIAVDNSTYKAWAQAGDLLVTDSGIETDARSLAGQVGLAKAMHKYALRKVITFHRTVQQAKDFARSLPDVVSWMPSDERPGGQLECAHVSGHMPTGQRLAHLQALRHPAKDTRSVLSNARCLSEGVDVPALDGVAFVQTRRSQVDIVQAVGRAIRRSEHKAQGTIVIPVFVDDDADAADTLSSSVYEPVWAVIKALRSHDESLGEALDQLRYRRGRQPSSGLNLPEQIHVDIPKTVDTSFAAAFSSRLVETSTGSWEEWFGLLKSYVEREGHASPPANWIEHGQRLGTWVSNMRAKHQKQTTALTDSQIQQLQDLPGWTWDELGARWDTFFDALTAYTRSTGHACPPRNYTINNLTLGIWVTHQRARYKAGKMPKDRALRLLTVPGWSWSPKWEAWETPLKQLQQFQRQYKHCNPHTNGSHPQLAKWVSRQRSQHKSGALPPDRAASLEAIPGWQWAARRRTSYDWELGLEHALDFAQREGHTQPPHHYVAGEFPLGKWMRAQRRLHQQGRLSSRRTSALKAIPGWTWHIIGGDPAKDPPVEWERAIQTATVFALREGHCCPPHDHVQHEIHIGRWVRQQRLKRRQGRLSDEQLQQLEALPGWAWDGQAAKWEISFAKLRHYSECEGHSSPPRECNGGPKGLANFVSWQRQFYAEGQLSSARISRLSSLPGWTWHAQDSRWQQGYDILKEFVDQEGHARPAGTLLWNNFKLGSWVLRQRQDYKKGRIQRERAELLAALPNWSWDPFDDLWDMRLEELRSYVERQGHCRPEPSDGGEHLFLWRWISKQRKAKKSGKLRQDRIARLETVPGWQWHTTQFRRN